MRTLTFEGAGWDCAANNGVGNCRIRTTFLNDKGEAIYFELAGHEISRYSTDEMKLFKFPWHITHLFKMKDKDARYTKAYKEFTDITKEYTKENILKFINDNLKCSFEQIVVDNDDWNGFDITGEYSTKER